jgi:hypothetical protein
MTDQQIAALREAAERAIRHEVFSAQLEFQARRNTLGPKDIVELLDRVAFLEERRQEHWGQLSQTLERAEKAEAGVSDHFKVDAPLTVEVTFDKETGNYNIVTRGASPKRKAHCSCSGKDKGHNNLDCNGHAEGCVMFTGALFCTAVLKREDGTRVCLRREGPNRSPHR